MSEKLAFLFPGQGSQGPGMGRDFYDNFAAAKEVFQEADELLSCHFSKLLFDGPQEELTLTKNSQLAIFICSMAILGTLQDQFPQLAPRACAGLSLGEYTALAASKRISFEDCLMLVKNRAAFMHDACLEKKGSMRVVLGLPLEAIQEIVTALNPPHAVWVANVNCPGQVVISGEEGALELAAKELLAKGAKRVLPLEVSGAFHSGLMQSAQEKLAPLLFSTTFVDSDIDLVMNISGGYESTTEKIRQALFAQITGSVLWEKSVRTMAESGVTQFIEIGYGTALTGMCRKTTQVPAMSVGKVADLDELAKMWSTV